MRVIVTAGGTREPLDDVRFLTNQSSGSLGIALARALLVRGCEVCLLAGPAVDLGAAGPGITCVRFGSAADLDRQLTEALSQGAALVLMAAAVADYSPTPATGKLGSKDEERTLTLRRNPKILDSLRERTDPGTILVGFKLLSGADPQTLIETAQRQNTRCDLDLTFANDLSEVQAHHHAGWIVPREGEPERVLGDKTTLAHAIAQASLDRVPGFRGLRHQPGAAPRGLSFETAGILLRLTRDMNIYPSKGQFSHRAGADGMWIPPRDPPAVDSDDLVYTTVHRWWGPRPPSHQAIDHALLYAHHPGITAILEQTDGLVLPDASTQGGAPGVLHALVRRALSGRAPEGGFAVHVDGRDVIGLSDVYQLLADWAVVRERALASIPGLPEPRVDPIFASSQLIGARIRSAAMDPAVAIWLQPAHRYLGYGEAIAARIAHLPVLVNERSAPWFRARGWHGEGAERHRLEPPATAPDLRRGVSVCLMNPSTRQVLLGARRAGPWPDFHAFPGGKIEPGESPLSAALRELHEETGIRLPPTPPLQTFDSYAASNGHSYHLTCFVLPTFSGAMPTPTDELHARWVPLDEALRIRALAPGVRRILRAIQCSG